MFNFRIISHLFVSATEPAVAASDTDEKHADMPATIDEPEDDFVCVARPVLPTAKSITVNGDFVEVTAGVDEPVELYQSTVERTPTKIVVTLHGEQPQTKVSHS
jgi:hypothetical protein